MNTEPAMNAAALRKSAIPPKGASSPLTALWHAARGDWDRAHTLVMDDGSAEAAWVHAYLHRVEGDQSNAGYWYAKAKKPHSKKPLDEEWGEIAGALLSGSGL